jgi:NAD(P)-dependent dehydrogenase (short-subunit alcohol dehydrogenase family)
MRSPSVLFMNRVYPPATGATGRVLRDLARAFAKAGWQVTVITCGPKSGYGSRRRSQGHSRQRANPSGRNFFIQLRMDKDAGDGFAAASNGPHRDAH